MSDVKFLNVVAKDGSTAAERFAAMEKDSYTFYFVGTDDLYIGAKKISNAADLAAAVTAIGDNTAAIALLNNTEATEGSVRNIIADYLDSLTAADIAIEDTAGNFDSTDVEGALAELAEASAGGVESKTVYITTTTGGTSDTYGKRYGVYQGSTGSSASPVVGELIANIDIPRDMVVESGSVETVTTADVPYAGAQVGDKYIDLVIANATSDHIYIPANSLVDVYTAEQNATQVQLVIDSNNEISATIVAGSVTATELAANAVVTAKIQDGAVTEAKLATAVQTKLNKDVGVTAVAEGTTDGTVSVTTNGTTVDVAVHGLGSAAYADAEDYDAAGTAASAIANLDTSSDVAIASKSGDVITIAAGIAEENGVIKAGSGTAITLEEVASTGAAADVSIADNAGYFTGTTVETALQEVGLTLTWQEI